MKVEYAGGSNLYVPATQLDVIQKYADSQAKRPKLNKLGTQGVGAYQDKSTQCGQKHRKDLVQLYAARQREEGFCYGEDTILAERVRRDVSV